MNSKNLAIAPTEFRFVEMLSDKDQYGGSIEFYVYLVTKWEGRIQNVTDEHSEIDWFDFATLSSLALASDTYFDLIRSTGLVD